MAKKKTKKNEKKLKKTNGSVGGKAMFMLMKRAKETKVY